MKRLVLLLSLTLAAAVGCSKEKNDSNKATDSQGASKAATTNDGAEKATPVATTDDNKVAKLLVLKFHHDS